MLFNEIYNRLENDIKTRYGDKVAEWFLNTFYDYEIRYLDTAFIRLFKANLMSSHLDLLKLKKLFDLSDVWELQNFSESTNENTNNVDGESNNSYSGYNVESDFSKLKTTQNSTSKHKNTTKSYNLTDEYIKLYSFEFDNLSNSIYRKFVNLFLTIL